MVVLPVAPGAMVPTRAISGHSPLPTSGADSSRCGTLSRFTNVTVTGWSRWLATGATPAAVMVTTGGVRGCDGSSSAESGRVTVRTVFDVQAPSSSAATASRLGTKSVYGLIVSV